MFAKITPVVKNLLIINVAIFLIDALAGLGLKDLLALRYILSDGFYPHQFFTYMFAHADRGHIFFNMLGLFFMGPMLEMRWGGKMFLAFYIITGLGGGIIYSAFNVYQNQQLEAQAEEYLSNPSYDNFESFYLDQDMAYYDWFNDYMDEFYKNPNDPALIQKSIEHTNNLIKQKTVNSKASMVGASGAVYGLLMAFGLLFPNVQFMLLIPPIPIKAKYLALGLGAMALLSGLARNTGDPVAHFAHLGGMLFAFLLIRFWHYK